MHDKSKPDHLAAFTAKMKAENLPRIVIDTFAHYYMQLVSGVTGFISDAEIRPVDIDEVADLSRLDDYAASGETALEKTVVIILNGGLGTSMGLRGPKSLLSVRDGKSFLAIILDQAARMGVKLVFMNSFSTHAATLAAVEALNPKTRPLFFLQHKFPKILKEDFGVALWPPNPALEWNPPGHGDIYAALHTSGVLKKLIDEGKAFALIANADNLGATLDRTLLGYFATRQLPLMMEVARRTPADMKGGHLARHKDGHFLLREIAQCPQNELQAFQDVHRYRFFNTNSLWLNLKALEAIIRKNQVIRLPIILNPKTIDPRDKTSPLVYQIETAMGAAISLFDQAAVVQVPLNRFMPVKKTPDLLILRSDRFQFSSDGYLVPNPRCRPGSIEVRLDSNYYGKIDDFEKRFERGVPGLLECESLTIEGDVHFEPNITIKGRVCIRNTRQTAASIPAQTVLETDLTF